MKDAKLLSLVVPAYKQEKTILEDVKNLDKVLASLPYRYEIIVVVDGFLDKTYEILEENKSKFKNLKVFGYERNWGKGYAVKFGVLKAKGDIIGFIDAGMDLDPSEISVALDLMEWNKADIIVGSKLHPESKVNYPIWRKILSWGYRTLTHILFGFNVKDTQVGMKFFRKKVAYDVFSKLAIKRYAFDIEVLTVAHKLGYKKIYESPVKLNFQRAAGITSTGFWKVIYWMLWDTAAVFYRLHILHYYDKK
ncbi:glycosyltransferase [Patescibacteria group bacterium]|nr:glycosyltransferase [Patescibacteria group bacterium]